FGLKTVALVGVGGGRASSSPPTPLVRSMARTQASLADGASIISRRCHGGSIEHPQPRRDREAAPSAACGSSRPVDGSGGTRDPYRGGPRIRRFSCVVHGAARPVRRARRRGPRAARTQGAGSCRPPHGVIVLDTNVVSELMRAEPAPQVASWVRSRDRRELFTSSITLAQIPDGLPPLPPSPS